MADIKISALSAASTLAGTETIPLVQGGVTKKVTTDQFLIKDGSGNVGLGVTPSAWTMKALDVSNSGSFYGDGAVSSWVAGVSQNAYFDGAWKYRATGHTAERYESGAGHAWYTALSGTAGNAISFTQAMTLDASGNLLVGCTSTPSGSVDGSAFEATGVGNQRKLKLSTSTTSTIGLIEFFNPNGSVGYISTNGTAATYNTSSDARLKENIAAADNGSALIDQLQVRKFDWKSDGSHQRFGFVAQELDAIYPEAVSKPTDPDEMMGVDYSKLVPLLVQEIQSLRALVAALEAK